VSSYLRVKVFICVSELQISKLVACYEGFSFTAAIGVVGVPIEPGDQSAFIVLIKAGHKGSLVMREHDSWLLGSFSFAKFLLNEGKSALVPDTGEEMHSREVTVCKQGGKTNHSCCVCAGNNVFSAT
jgi:hypothetical protein